jgi:hypothetical protein
MLWTLAFVLFLNAGDAKVSGGVFKTKAACESIRAQLLEVQESKQLPDGAHALSVGQCQIWLDPKASLHP